MPEIVKQDEYIYAWRVWKIDFYNDGTGDFKPYLFSPQRKMLWKPGVNEAFCIELDDTSREDPAWHPSPQLFCNCGFYGVRELSMVKEWGFNSDLPFVAGRIEMSGVIIEASKGWISQYSRIAEIHMIDSRCHSQAESHTDFLSMNRNRCTCSGGNNNFDERSIFPITTDTVKQVAEIYGASLEISKGPSCPCLGCKHVESMRKIGNRRYDYRLGAYKLRHTGD